MAGNLSNGGEKVEGGEGGEGGGREWKGNYHEMFNAFGGDSKTNLLKPFVDIAGDVLSDPINTLSSRFKKRKQTLSPRKQRIAKKAAGDSNAPAK